MLMNLVGLRDLGVRRLGSTLTPVSDVLRLLAGPLGAKIAAGAIALSAVGYLSQSMLTAPRVYFAMARDGLFFRRVAELAASSRAPVIAILVQAAWTGVLALSGSYEQILSYVIAMNFLFFGVTASSLFLFRIRTGSARRSSRSPQACSSSPARRWWRARFGPTPWTV
jgi:APA family basic amino acid/polyamine antiporter